MTWVFIGLLLGSVVTSTHESEEACLGRKAVLARAGVVGECKMMVPLQAPDNLTIVPLTSSGTIQ